MASLCKYDYGEDDFDAVRFGIMGTDVEKERWFDYEFSGADKVLLQIALDPGSSVVFLRVRCLTELLSKISVATKIASYYRLVR